MPVRLYVSGPVTGIDDENRAAFEEAHDRLTLVGGYDVSIPIESVRPEASHEEAMLLCIHHLTTTDWRGRYPVPSYDGVALLDGWEQSRGARLERVVAEACGIPCKPVGEWIKEAAR